MHVLHDVQHHFTDVANLCCFPPRGENIKLLNDMTGVQLSVEKIIVLLV